MARPTKSDDEKRSERFNLRFTLDELIHVQTQAGNAGLGVHEYARRRVLGHRVQAVHSRADAMLLVELNRIGVNLNQIARDHNSGRGLDHEAGVLLAELRGVLDRIGGGNGS